MELQSRCVVHGFSLLSDEGSQNMVIIGADRMRACMLPAPWIRQRTVGYTVKAEASLAGDRRLLRWADKLGERRWAIENARGLGRHLAQWLVARDEVVDDVPSTATARVRERAGTARTSSWR